MDKRLLSITGSVGSWLSFLVHDVTGEYHVGIDLAGIVVDEFPLGEKSQPGQMHFGLFVVPQIRDFFLKLGWVGVAFAAVNFDFQETFIHL